HLLYPSLLSHPPAPPRSLPSSPTRRSSDLLMRRQGLAEFPDAVTARGAKHLDELATMVAAGCRAVMLFLIQIGSAERFALAADVDPTYARAFARARAAGVEAIAYRCLITADGIRRARAVPIEETIIPLDTAPRPRLRAGRVA